MNKQRGEQLTHDNPHGIAHSQKDCCNGSLLIAEPMLTNFGWHARYERTSNPSQGLTDQGKIELVVWVEIIAEMR